MLRHDPTMINGLHSGVLSNDSNIYVFPITWKPDEWLITANCTGGYILVYPQNGRGALSFKLDRGHIRVPLKTDAITIETVGVTGFFDAHPVRNRKEFGVTLSIGSYLAKILAMFGSSIVAYWPLSETSGSIAFDVSGNGRNGTHTAVTLNQPGIGDGLAATKYDGSTSFTNIFSAGLASAFNNQELTVSCWFQAANAGVWIDTLSRFFVRLSADASNLINLNKASANNLVNTNYVAGAVNSNQTGADSAIAWQQIAITASKSNDRVRLYLNGSQVGATINGLGVWAGALTVAIIGAISTAPAGVWNGNLAHVFILKREATPQEIANVAIVSG